MNMEFGFWETVGLIIAVLSLGAAGKYVDNRFDELENKLDDVVERLNELMPDRDDDQGGLK
jgi:hypothetical protein